MNLPDELKQGPGFIVSFCNALRACVKGMQLTAGLNTTITETDNGTAVNVDLSSVSGSDIAATMYMASSGELVNVTLKGDIAE